jgi:predicted RNase H-like HicB family nuclease
MLSPNAIIFAECISGGTTVEEALENGRNALRATIATLKSRKLHCAGLGGRR